MTTDTPFVPLTGIKPSRREAMNYVEGFVAAVPAANKEAYRKHAAVNHRRVYGGLRRCSTAGTTSTGGS